MYVRETEVTMTDCFVTGNTAKDAGGGMVVELGTFTMKNGNITNNTGHIAGGISIRGTYFTMENGVISSNTANISDTNGVYLMSNSGNASVFKMLGSARVNSNNSVFITNGSAIEVVSNNLSAAAPVADIIGNSLPSNTLILIGTGVGQYHNKFRYNNSYTIKNNGTTP
jgi:hypothetical protein